MDWPDGPRTKNWIWPGRREERGHEEPKGVADAEAVKKKKAEDEDEGQDDEDEEDEYNNDDGQ